MDKWSNEPWIRPNMLIVSKQKFARVSPRKLRLIASSIKKANSPEEAISYLELVPQKAAVVLAKVIKTAIANAKNNSKVEGVLKVKELQINQGPTLKRGIAVSRGRFHPIQKKTSHVTVILETEQQKDGKEVKR